MLHQLSDDLASLSISFLISDFIFVPDQSSNRSLLLEQITQISRQGFSVLLKDTSSGAESEHEPSRRMKGREHG